MVIFLKNFFNVAKGLPRYHVPLLSESIRKGGNA